MNVIDLHPMPPCLSISRENWIATSPVLRDEIVRAWQELSAGVAIGQDVRSGRRKRALAPSFYALHLLDMDIWRRPDAKKTAEAEALRAKLAPDVERMKANDDLAEYHEFFAAKKGTLADAVREYVHTEYLLRTDFVKGLELIAKKIGVDLAAILAEQQDSHRQTNEHIQSLTPEQHAELQAS